jgi:hypothetical protein
MVLIVVYNITLLVRLLLLIFPYLVPFGLEKIKAWYLSLIT